MARAQRRRTSPSMRPREILASFDERGIALAGAAIIHPLDMEEQDQLQSATQVAMERWMEIGVMEQWRDTFIRCREEIERFPPHLRERARAVGNACAYAELVSHTPGLHPEVRAVLARRWERAAAAASHAGTTAGEVLEALLLAHPGGALPELLETAQACVHLPMNAAAGTHQEPASGGSAALPPAAQQTA